MQIRNIVAKISFCFLRKKVFNDWIMTKNGVNYSFKYSGWAGFSNLVVQFQLFKNDLLSEKVISCYFHNFKA